MIKVNISKDELGNIIEILIKGHANSAPHGQDLVCAGVSAIIVGGMNAINEKKDFILEIKEGYSLIKRVKFSNIKDNEVINVIYTQLNTIQESYPKFIKIEIN